MNDLTFKNVIEIEPRMVLEIAMGLRNPQEIAEDYGFSEEQWISLKTHEPFVKQVDDKKAELKESGVTFKLKSALIAEELLESLYLKASAEDATLHAVLESLKFTSRAAGLDAPKQDGVAAGSGFSINITIGGQAVKISGQHRPTEEPQDESNIIDVEEHFDFTSSFGAYTPTQLPA